MAVHIVSVFVSVLVWGQFLTTFALHLRIYSSPSLFKIRRECLLSHKCSRFPCRDVLLKFESHVMLKALCSGTGWELTLNRNTERDLFRALPFPHGFLNPSAVLSKESHSTSCPTVKSSLSWDGYRDVWAFRHALLLSTLSQ